MAIGDLLWACPECGEDGGLRPARNGETCSACGTRYRRGRGALIEATRPGHASVARQAAEWLERLAEAAPPGDANDRGPIRQDRVLARFASGEESIRLGSEYLGRIERLAPGREGKLELTSNHIRFVGDDGSARSWPLDALTAVQASSSTLQIKPSREPVVSLRFPDASIRRWQVLIEDVLRRLYRAEGRGEIVEFQPRIVTR